MIRFRGRMVPSVVYSVPFVLKLLVINLCQVRLETSLYKFSIFLFTFLTHNHQSVKLIYYLNYDTGKWNKVFFTLIICYPGFNPVGSDVFDNKGMS